MTRATSIHIDMAALSHNINHIQTLAPHSKILAMVKANAYGHQVALCKSLNGVDAFGVACIEEALELKNIGIDKPIVLVEGFFTADELPIIDNNQFEIVVHHASQINILKKYAAQKPLRVWLKLDSGMHRLGFLPETFLDAWHTLNSLPQVAKPMTLMTHFACADQVEDTFTDKQILCFNEITKNLLGPKSLANSAGILAWPQTHADWVRPGIMLYGISPFPNTTGLEFNLKPVMTLQSELISIKTIKAGEIVGYTGRWVCSEDMQVGIVACGYADGYPQMTADNTPVLINQKLASIAGRVSMDMLAVDLRNHPTAKIGDPAILWGKGLPVEIIAKAANMSPYQVVCNISKRVKINFNI